MSQNKIDKLFHSKLDTLEMIPSSQAWKALDQHLNRKKVASFWMYSGIAASIALLITVGFIMFNIEWVSQENIALQNETINPKQLNESSKDTIKTEILAKEDEEQKPIRKIKPIHVPIIENHLYTDKSSIVEELNSDQKDVEKVVEVANTIDVDTISLTPENRDPVRVSYHFSSPTIQGSSLVMIDTVHQERGIKKILKTVKSLPTQGILADIRSAKNEIFKFN